VKFNKGDMVMLIGCDDFMPPIGSVGVVLGEDRAGGILDYDVEFDGHPCPNPPGTFWCIPPYWLMRIDPLQEARDIISSVVIPA